MSQKIYFITYGDSSKYYLSKKHIINLAKNSNFFDDCLALNLNDVDEEYREKYSKIFTLERGGGYYIWKPRIIYNLLQKLNENDIVVYTDAGSSFNYFAKKRFYEYIEMINDSDFGNLRFENKKENIEKFWTTREIFDYFKINTDSKYANTTQLMGGHLIFKKNNHTNIFFEKFFEILNYDEKLVTDYYEKNQNDFFIENRHDQSIMSILTKLYGGIIIQNETYFTKDSSEQIDFPFLSVRNYGHGFRDRIKYQLNINKIKTTPIWF